MASKCSSAWPRSPCSGRSWCSGSVAWRPPCSASAVRLTPLTDTNADELIRAVPLLSGHRDAPPAGTGALAGTLLRVSRLADDLPEVAELDLSPVIARPDGVCAVGARVRVSPAPPRDRSCASCAEPAAREACSPTAAIGAVAELSDAWAVAVSGQRCRVWSGGLDGPGRRLPGVWGEWWRFRAPPLAATRWRGSSGGCRPRSGKPIPPRRGAARAGRTGGSRGCAWCCRTGLRRAGRGAGR